MNNKTMFSDWDFGHYAITNGESRLWVCNGFLSFKDDAGVPVLAGYNIFGRWSIWREYKRECRLRFEAKCCNQEVES